MDRRVVTTCHLPVAFTYSNGRYVECWMDGCLLSTHWIEDQETKSDHQRRLAWTEDQQRYYETADVGGVLSVRWYDPSRDLVCNEQYQKKAQGVWERHM